MGQQGQGNRLGGASLDGSGGQPMRQPWGAPSPAWNVPRNNGPQSTTTSMPGSMASLNNGMAHIGVSAAAQPIALFPAALPPPPAMP